VKEPRPDALTVAETWFDASKYFLGDMFDSTMNYIFRNAVLDFAAGGKATAKKDLARIASDYGHVYVATVAYGAKDVHTLKVFHEAEAYAGPSLIVAYSPCIAHGVDMLYNQRQQDMAVKSGHWPLFRHDPRLEAAGANPFKLDSAAPSQPMQE